MLLLLFFHTECSTCCCAGGMGTVGYVQYGIASYYGKEFHGKKTASGETYNMNDYTCAHRTLAFDTRVRVTNLENQKSVVVRVNDRGPFIKGRIVDLSYAAAKRIDLVKDGTVKVKLEVVQ
jgi:rare lipoprotein A